jgi:hypothetical protein
MIALSQMKLPERDATMIGKMLRFPLALSAAAMLSSAAFAQDDPDALAAATGRLDSGMTLARSQIGASDLPGALGTLERLLFAFPEAVPPRLLYASLLCRLDDRQGAELELGLLDGKPIADSDWAGVAAACGPVQRPAPPRRGKRR